MPTGNDEVLDEPINTVTETTTTTTTTTIMDNNDDDKDNLTIENNDTNNDSNNDGKGQICGTKLPTGTFDPTPYIQRARVTRPAPPKPSCNPMQFVQIKPCNLYQSAQEQLKRAEEVKKVKEIKKEDPEDWQNNLDNWKSSRRKRVEHIIDRVVEVKKLELEEHDRTRRKSKTFSEMMEERTNKGRTNKLASLAVYTEDESHDLSDLGIGTSSASGKSSLSEDYDNNSVLSDNADTEKPINFKNDNNSNNGDLIESEGTTREYISSPGYDTSSSTAPTSSPDPCEYTYEGAIEDYKSRISKAVASTTKHNFNNNNNNNNNNMNNTNNNYRNHKDSTPERTSEQYFPRRMSGSKIEDRLMNFEIKSVNDTFNESGLSSNIVKKDLPKVDILKRRELFEKENSPTANNDTTKERRFSGANSADLQNTKSIRERLSSLEKKPSIEDDKKKVNRLSGDITSIKNRLQNLEQNNNQIVETTSDKNKITNKIVDVPVLSLKDRLSSLQSAVTKEEIKKPVVLIDEHQLEILKKEDFEKQQALKRNGLSNQTNSTIVTATTNTLMTLNPSASANIDDEQHSNSSHEILSIPDESNIDTDREDSGIHTTDVSCSVSQTDEQAELVNEENHHQHPINIDNLHHNHHHNHHHIINNDHPNDHNHHCSNNSTSNDLDEVKLSLQTVDSRIPINDENIIHNNQNEDINITTNKISEPSNNDMDISVSQINSPISESPSHSSSISSSSQTIIFDSKNSFGDGINSNLINNQNHNILLANIDGNNLEGVGTSHNIDIITKNKTINSCNQVVVDLTNSCNASNKLLTTPSKVSSCQNYNINCIDNDTGRYIICIVNPNNIGNNLEKSYLPIKPLLHYKNNNNDFELQSISKFENSPQNSPTIIFDNSNNLPSFSSSTNKTLTSTQFTATTSETNNANNKIDMPLTKNNDDTSSDNKNTPVLKRAETIDEVICNKLDVHNLKPSVKLSTPFIEVNLEDIAKCEKNASKLEPYNNSNLEIRNPSPTPSEVFDQIVASCLTDSSTRSSLISEIELPNSNPNITQNQKPLTYERCKSIEEIICDKIDVKNKPPSVSLSTACIEINKDDIDRIETNNLNMLNNSTKNSDNSIEKLIETPSDILDQIIASNLPDYIPNSKNNNETDTKTFENNEKSIQSPISIEIPNSDDQKSSTSKGPLFSPNTMKKLSGIESLMSILNRENELIKSGSTSPSSPISPQINILDYKSKKSPLSPTTEDKKPISTIMKPKTDTNFSISSMKQEQTASPLAARKLLEMSPTLTKKPPVSPTSPIAIRRALYNNNSNMNSPIIPLSPPKLFHSSKPIAAPRKCPMVLDISECSENKSQSPIGSPTTPPQAPPRNKSLLFSIGPMQPGSYKNITLLKSENVPQIRENVVHQSISLNTDSDDLARRTSNYQLPPETSNVSFKSDDNKIESKTFENIINNKNVNKVPIPPPRNASSLYKIATASQNNANNIIKSSQLENKTIMDIQKPLNISITETPMKTKSPAVSPKPKLPPKPDYLKGSPIPAKRLQFNRPDNLNLSKQQSSSSSSQNDLSSPIQNSSGNSTPKTPGILVAKLEVVETTIKVTSNDNSPQSRPMSPISSPPSSLPSSPKLNRSPKFNQKTHPNNTSTNTNTNATTTNSNSNNNNSKTKNIFEFIKKNFNNTNENDESDFNLDEKIIVDNSKFYISSEDIGEITPKPTSSTTTTNNDFDLNDVSEAIEMALKAIDTETPDDEEKPKNDLLNNQEQQQEQQQQQQQQPQQQHPTQLIVEEIETTIITNSIPTSSQFNTREPIYQNFNDTQNSINVDTNNIIKQNSSIENQLYSSPIKLKSNPPSQQTNNTKIQTETQSNSANNKMNSFILNSKLITNDIKISSQIIDEPYYSVPKPSEPYYEVPKAPKPIPVYENIDLFYNQISLQSDDGHITGIFNNNLNGNISLEPPKEKPPPPPIDDLSDNDADDEDLNKNGYHTYETIDHKNQTKNNKNLSSTTTTTDQIDGINNHQNSNELINNVCNSKPSVKRMNSTKRIKKELRNKRSSFLGIEGTYDDDSYLELTVAPPPDMVKLLQEERRLEKQLYMKAGLYDSSDAADSRDSGVSENHSRQSSEPFTNSSEEHEDLLKKKEKEIIEVLEKEEEKQKQNSNWKDTKQFDTETKMQGIEDQIREQEEVLRVEKELLQLEQEELKRQRENLMVRENIARQELQHGAKMLMSATRKSLADINAPIPQTAVPQQQQHKISSNKISNDENHQSSNVNHYANLPAHQIYQCVETDYRKSMSDLHDFNTSNKIQQRNGLSIVTTPTAATTATTTTPNAPAKPIRSNLSIDAGNLKSIPNGHITNYIPNGGGLVKIANSPTHTHSNSTPAHHSHNSQLLQHSQSNDDFVPLRNYQINTTHHNGGNMTRNTLLALSATPKPKYTDAWVQQSTQQQNHNKLGGYQQTSADRAHEAWLNQQKRKSVPDNFNYNKHWLIQEAEQRRIDQQRGLFRQNYNGGVSNATTISTNGWTNSAIQRNGSSDNKPLPDAVIQTITQRVQSKGIGERKRLEAISTESLTSSTNSIMNSQTIHSPITNSPLHNDGPNLTQTQQDKVLSVSGRKKCSHCGEELGRGAAMIIESLRLFYHISCFKCCVCHVQLGDGLNGTDVRVRNQKLHCQNCYSSDDGIKFSCV